VIGAKRKLALNGFRGRVSAVDESFMHEILLLLVAVFQLNRPKVPICRLLAANLLNHTPKNCR